MVVSWRLGSALGGMVFVAVLIFSGYPPPTFSQNLRNIGVMKHLARSQSDAWLPIFYRGVDGKTLLRFGRGVSGLRSFLPIFRISNHAADTGHYSFEQIKITPGGTWFLRGGRVGARRGG